MSLHCRDDEICVASRSKRLNAMRYDTARCAPYRVTPQSLRLIALGLIAALIASIAAPSAFAQRADDSYKGPSTGGGLDDQLRGMAPQKAPPPASPGLRGRDAAPAAGVGLR